jgi:hypothetical protein
MASIAWNFDDSKNNMKNDKSEIIFHNIENSSAKNENNIEKSMMKFYYLLIRSHKKFHLHFKVKARLRTINKIEWTKIELLQWIFLFFIPNNFLDDTKFNFEKYKDLNGQILNKLKIEEIDKIDFNYGRLLQTQFKQFNTSDEIKSTYFIKQ